MKVQDLLEHASQHQKFAYQLLKQFRELAVPYQLVIGSALSWPKISQDRIVYGATLKDAVRGNGNHKDRVEDRLPVAHRAKGFMRDLAEKLRELMDQGHTIQILTGNEGHRDGETANKDNVLELLKKHFVEYGRFSRDVDHGPTLWWSVSTPKTENDVKALNLHMKMHVTNPEDSYYEGFYTFADVTDRELMDAWNAVNPQWWYHSHETKGMAPDRAEKISEETIQFYKDMVKHFSDHVLTVPEGATLHLYGLSKKVGFYKRQSTELDRDEFIELCKAMADKQSIWAKA